MTYFCSPDQIAIRRIAFCPTCDKRRRFAGFDQFWCGPTWTCLACGDSWSDGWRLPRPFKRAWRGKSRARAAELWQSGVRAWSAPHMAWLEAQNAPYGAATEDRAQVVGPLSGFPEALAAERAGSAASRPPVTGTGRPVAGGHQDHTPGVGK